MNRYYLLLATLMCTLTLHAQTIFTYGNNAVTKDEFLRAYNKNSTPVTDKEKSIREYLELYSNFKLKVKAAEALRLDTLPQIQNDIANFRSQVQENYMNDEKGLAKLMDEAFRRSQEDLHVVHFSVAVDTAKGADTLKAFQSITAAHQTLSAGNVGYKSLAEKHALRYGDLGYITVFSVPYEYENVIYALNPGQVSKPYRSKSAWHLFKVVEKRRSIGKWKIAQILFMYPPDGGQDIREAIKRKADSVYNLLKAGADFSEMAKLYSEDRLTYMTGGEMPEFGAGKFDAEFESEVLKLHKDGELGQPFSTSFGVHILKRLSHTETPGQKDNAALQYEHKQKILQDSRINEAKESFAREIISLVGYKRNPAVKDEELFRYADSVMKNPDADNSKKYPLSNKTIITFKNGSLKGTDWLKFIREYKANNDLYKGEGNIALWNKFATISALDYYKKNLETYNPDFRFQMKEFKEGNMLFEIMERNVWSLAATDSAGLVQYYNANRSKYKWAASADVVMINAADETTAMAAMESLKKGKSWREIADASEGKIQADSGRYELTQVVDSSATGPTAGSFSTRTHSTDGSVAFVQYLKVYPADQQRSFEEARGLVINDYQLVLEKKWLATLHRKYPVKVNEAVVKQIIN